MARALIILAFIGITIAVVFYMLHIATLTSPQSQPRQQLAALNLTLLRTSVLQYKIQNDKYPASLADLKSFDPAVPSNLGFAGNTLTYIVPPEDASEATPGIILFYNKLPDGTYSVIDLDGRTYTATESQLHSRLAK